MDGASKLGYKRVSTSVRPPRLAVLLPAQTDWAKTARLIIESFSRMWGGVSAIPVACSLDGTLSEVSLRLLQAYDPDWLATFSWTYGAWQRIDPTGYSAWERNATRRATRGTTTTPKEWRARFRSADWSTRPVNHWSPTKEKSAAILEWCSPFNWEGEAFQESVTADWIPTGHISDITQYDVETAAPWAPRHEPDWPVELQLLVESRFGQVSPKHEVALATYDIEVARPALSAASLADLLLACWSVPRSPVELQVVRELGGEAPRIPLDSAPFQVAAAGCGWFLSSLASWNERPYVIVVGDSHEDFALAFALDRILGGAAWLPTRLLRPANSIRRKHVLSTLSSAIARVSGYGHDQREVVVTSISRKQNFLNSVISDAALGLFPDVTSWAKLREPIDLFPLGPTQTLLDAKANQILSFEPFVGAEQETQIPTPLPSVIPTRQALDNEQIPFTRYPTWMVDVDIADYLVPNRSALQPSLQHPDVVERDIRPGKDGVTYHSQAAIVLTGVPLERSVASPRLKLPEPAEAMDLIIQQAGFTSAVSQAGRYSQHILQVFGGLRPTAALFRNPQLLSFFHAYLAASPSEVDPGVFLKPLGRRFLRFAEAKSVMGLDDARTRDHLDVLIARGVLKRGLILKCRTCNFMSWYGTSSLGDGGTVLCSRCSSDLPVTRESWRIPAAEPYWYYQLDELVYLAILSNAGAPLLALDYLSSRARRFMFSPELELRKDNQQFAEFDIWAFIDGKVVLGEAKTSATLGNARNTRETIERVHEFANAAHIDQIVFATSATQWESATRNRIATELRSLHVPIVILENLVGNVSKSTL